MGTNEHFNFTFMGIKENDEIEEGGEMEFGERIKILRKEKGLTQAQLAKEAHLSRRSVGGYEQEGKRPRKRETYEKLAEILDCDVNDLLMEDESDLPAGFSEVSSIMTVAAISGGLAALAGPILATSLMIPGAIASIAAGGATAHGMAKFAEAQKAEAAPLSHAKEQLTQYIKDHKRFLAMSTGLIYAKLAESGIAFAPGSEPMANNAIGPERVITIQSNGIDDWWLVFEATSSLKLYKEVETQYKLEANTLMSRFLPYAPNSHRKVSIVVEDEGLFEALTHMGYCNSYRGNMSVIYVNSNEASIEREVYIATYDGGCSTSELMYIVKEAQHE